MASASTPLHGDRPGPSPVGLVALLLFRGLSFLGLHALVAGLLSVGGTVNPWFVAGHWWQLFGTISNVLTGLLLLSLLRRERAAFAAVLSPVRPGPGGPVVWAGGIVVLVVSALLLARLFMAGFQSAATILVNPIPPWAAITGGVGFPITLAAVELPLYYGYLLPRLRGHGLSPVLAIAVVAVVHTAQYAALPFLPAMPYFLYRSLMTAPFALLAGVLTVGRRRFLLPLMLAQLVVYAWAGVRLIAVSL